MILSKSIRILSACLILCLFITGYAYPADIHRFDQYLKSNWYGAYMTGAKAGYVNTVLESVNIPIDGWKAQTLLVMKFKMGDQELTMTTDDVRIFKSPNGELYSSKLTVSSITGNLEATGRVDGNKFVVETNIGGQKTEKSFDYPIDYLDSLLATEMMISSGKVAIGDSFTYASFEPTPPLTGLIHQNTKIISKDQMLVGGVPVDIYNVVKFCPEAKIIEESKLDRYGNLLEGTVAGQITLKLEDEGLAKRLDTTYDILTNNLVIPDKKLENLQALNSVRLRVSGIDSSSVLQTSMQKFSTDNRGAIILEIKKETAPSNSPLLPVSSDEANSFLASDPYEQSDAPEIIKLAGEIVGTEKDSWVAAKKINAWVYKNIKKQFTPDLSNALQTLNSRRGDCGEHTALMVALLRAAGIPARPVVGLVYWPPGNGFGYHAWVDAYIGQWIEMDPTWGEDLANPAHIALTHGDIIQQASVISKVMGKMKIEVLNAE